MKPRTVADCRGPGICPYVSCRLNILIDIRRGKTLTTGARYDSLIINGRGHKPLRMRGRIRNVDDDELEEFADEVVARAEQMESTCLLDYLEKDERLTSQQIAELYGLNRQGIEQIESRALRKLSGGVVGGFEDPTFVPTERLRRTNAPKTLR